MSKLRLAQLITATLFFVAFYFAITGSFDFTYAFLLFVAMIVVRVLRYLYKD